jgi:NTP pyrophosphatase (non-canonical NTP hydrolase)
MDLSIIQEDIKVWADAKIPQRTVAGQLIHLQNELNELMDEWKTQDLEKFKEELADVVIVAINIAGQANIDLEAQIMRKMEINKNRTWSAPDKDGVIHHN